MLSLAKDFRYADDFAREYGVKMLTYGPPGSGKTPLLNTAPRPVLMAVEPGLLSMLGMKIPTIVCETPARVDEFFDWLFRSSEAGQFDTVGIDSGSEIAEMIATEELSKKSASGAKVDGKAAYGAMSRRVYDKYLQPLYKMRNKHAYIICKRGLRTVSGIEKTVPYWPGRDLYTRVPHLYDTIAYLDTVQHITPQGLQTFQALRCRGTVEIEARARSPFVNELEPCDLGALFNKCMSSQGYGAR